MKKFKIITLVTLSLFASAFAQKDITKTFPAEKNDDLFISVNAENITINFWNKSEVKLTLSNIDTDNIEDVQLEKTGKKITLKYNPDFSDENSNVLAYIPADLNLEIRNASNGGEITLNGNLNGKCKITSSGSDVKLKDVSGDLNVTTSGGEIFVGNIKGSVNLSTAGGDIFTGNLSKAANISTAGGDIKTGFLSGESNLATAGGDIIFSGASAKVNSSTAGGDIEAGEANADANLTTSGGSVSVKTGKGKLELKTSGGNIRVDKMSGELETSTAGGNIILNELHGSVDAKTSGGNIGINFASVGSNDSKVSNAGGNIILRFPSDAKATIEVTIGLNILIEEDEIAEYLKSDFKADEVSLHKSKKKIIAKYNLNGGGNKIVVRTANGVVDLKKSK